MYIFPTSFEGNFLFFPNIEQTADFYAIFFFSHYLHNDCILYAMYKTSGYLRNNIEKTVNGPCI